MTLAEQITSAVSAATTAERCRVLVEELPGMLRQERERVLADVHGVMVLVLKRNPVVIDSAELRNALRAAGVYTSPMEELHELRTP